jgi:AraC-like DNA-binding protein
MCGISEDYFRKIFKNTFEISPRKYINDMKISYAKELITSGMYTVTEAAELSGYTDMSYFSREFKKAFGICPADYRKHEGVSLIN